MSKKLVLIDGNSIANRAFYGVPDLTNAEGLHTNAIYGFLNIMFKILAEEQPQYLAVAFDVHAPTFRHKMYAEYKGTRKPMPTELKEQIPVLKDLLKAMKIKIVEMAGFEADDLLGTLAKRGEAEGYSVALISGDRDLLQICTDVIKVRIPKTKGGHTETEDYYTQDVIEKYGITPLQVIELKALMGDSSDNIPGVPKIGEKTATALVQQYGCIENLKEHIPEITKNSIRTTLEENFESAVFSKTLATIDINAPIEADFTRMELSELFTPEAYAIVKRLGFKNMLSKFQPEDTGAASLQIEENFRIEYDFDGVNKLFDSCVKSDWAFDLVHEEGQILGLVLGLCDEQYTYIPAVNFCNSDFLTERLVSAIQSSKGTVSVFDLKKQMHLLGKNADSIDMSLATKQIFDCKIAAYLLNPLKNDYDLEDIASEHLGLMIKGQKECFGKKSLKEVFEEDETSLRNFVCHNAHVCLKSSTVLKNKLSDKGMLDLFRNIEMPLAVCLFRMEREGVLVRVEELKKYSDTLNQELIKLEELIFSEAGHEFNINSPKQLAQVLFEEMNLPGGKKTKTGYSTAADVLEKMAEDIPFVQHILRYRTISKLKSTYADGLVQYIGEDGRIHSTFHQTITATGRLSSADPNLQNIPIRMEEGRLIRRAFVPKDGCVFVDADYSQIELRLMAHMSSDEKLIEAYSRADDIHAITASEVFHVPLNEVTPLLRRNAKAVNFGIIYGISSFGLSQDLSISRKEAKEYIDRYFETYPQVKMFIDNLVEDAKDTGRAITMYGRIRPIPELASNNFMQRQFGERVAMNAPIQGSAADIMKIAMLHVMKRLDDENLKSKMLLQVHDELLIEAYADELDQVKQILSEEMVKAADLKVQLEIDMHEGNNWYDAK